MSEQEAIYEEEEEKESKRKDSFAAGRILGIVKRKDPELYEEIVQIAQAEGKKASDIILEALYVYRDYKTMVGIDGRCLAYSMQLLDHLIKRVIQMILTAQQYFTSEFFQQQVEILAQIQQQQQAAMQQAYKHAKAEKLAPFKEKMIELTLNLVMNLITALTTNMMKIMVSSGMRAGPSTSSTSSTGSIPQKPSLPSSSKPKIVESE